MKNYNRHNDLISNFFYLVNRISDNLLFINIDQVGIDRSINDHLNYEIPLQNFKRDIDIYPTDMMDVYNSEEKKELIKIYTILEGKCKINNSIFEDNNCLLISRFFKENWKAFIKQEIIKNLKNIPLDKMIQLIIISLEETKYRAKFVWDLFNDINGRNRDNKDVNSAHYLMTKFNIDNDIDWVKNLTIKDIENQKIILSPKLKKVTLISLITEIQKGKKNYNEKISLEIKKFINFITDENSTSSDYNLSFLKNKDENREFAKIFLLLQSKGLILNEKKGELTKILADCLNISDSTLNHLYSLDTLKKELDNDSTDMANFINDLL